MKTRLISGVVLSLIFFATPSLLAAESTAGWHAQNLGQAVGYMLLFAGIGIVAAIVGYKLFDKCTPGDLHKEIVENKNMAVAVVAAAVILGVCIIIAAAMLG
jgi:putative membrane protein